MCLADIVGLQGLRKVALLVMARWRAVPNDIRMGAMLPFSTENMYSMSQYVTREGCGRLWGTHIVGCALLVPLLDEFLQLFVCHVILPVHARSTVRQVTCGAPRNCQQGSLAMVTPLTALPSP